MPTSTAVAPTVPGARRLTGWSETWRLTLVVLLGIGGWFLELTDSTTTGTPLEILGLLAGVGCIVAVHWRRHYPALLALITMAVSSFSGLAAGASVLALLSLSTTRRWRPILLTFAVAVAGEALSARIRPAAPNEDPWWLLPIFGTVFFGLIVALGLYIGTRRDLSRQREDAADREQVTREHQARAHEREKIAREMHDVLAHRISLVAMHAGAMTYRADLSRDELMDSAEVVQTNAHQALVELREVLGVLRETPGLPAQPPRPQPTLADLADLIEEASSAGGPVEVIDGVPGKSQLPDLTGRTAYRIIQEALTNVRKHAPGATATLRIGGSAGSGLDIEVGNHRIVSDIGTADAGLSGVGLPGAGLGLVGLSERADLVGGKLTAGPVGADFVVRAWLPWLR